jgi:hypothetical protein
MTAPEVSVAELRALSLHADRRLALQRRRVYAGQGDLRRVAELEREALGAAERLRRALAAERA